MKRWLLLAVMVLTMVIVGGVSYFTSQQVQAQTGSSMPVTVTVTRGNVQQVVTAAGKLVHTRKVTLSMGASGQLSQINVRAGEGVHRGDVLATLDTTDLQRQVAQAEQAYLIQQATYSQTLQPEVSTVAAARAAVRSATAAYEAAKQKDLTQPDQITLSCFDLSSAAEMLGQARDAYQAVADDFQGRHYDLTQAARARLEMAQNNYEAVLARCNLAKSNISDSNVQAAQARVLEAQQTLTHLISPTTTSLITAQADLELARLALEAARRQLAHTTIVAPFDGLVLEIHNQVGDRLNANAAVIVLADPRALEVEADVDEKDFGLVQIGQPAQLLFDARTDITATGQVALLVPERLPGSQALYPVHIVFDDLPEGLAADMSVDASIAIASRSNVLRLPRAVVHAKADNTAQVQVWINDQVELRSIKVGLRGDLYVEVLDGLQAGDQVVSQ